MKQITTYEMVKHGLFEPRKAPGMELGDFGGVATGIGNTEQLAMEDAFNELQNMDWSVEECPPLLDEYPLAGGEAAPEGKTWLVSVRVK
jgi:hypothetical protein